MPTPLIPCEFFLIRYVPDVVKGEFTNIGVLLREADPAANNPAIPRLRFTRDWSRVRCMHTDADIPLLEGLESEVLDRLLSEQDSTATYPKPILSALADSLSNSIQISEPRACLAENLAVELDQLMRLYVEPLKGNRPIRTLTGRAAIAATMRSTFEKAGVWGQMQKRIRAAQYTRPGDPLKLDCGYSVDVPDAERETTNRNDLIRIFHAVSLGSDIESARSLAFTAPQLREGAIRSNRKACVDAGRRWTGLEFDLAAVVEPIRSISNESDEDPEAGDFSDEAAELYLFGVFAMESAGIRVLTMNNLVAAAETARSELRI